MKVTTKQRSSNMLDKLQVFFEMNDAENDVLRSVASLVNKVEKMRINSKKQKTDYKWFFFKYVRWKHNFSYYFIEIV